MSYVIQNFYKPTSLVIANERFRLLLRCINLFKLFTFFKLFIFYNKTPIELCFLPKYFSKIFLEYYDTKASFFYTLFYIETLPHRTTKFHRTLRIYALFVLLRLFDQKKSSYWTVRPQTYLVANTYFFPVQAVFFPFKKYIYKPLFTFLMLIVPTQWPVLTSTYAFSRVFFYPSFVFKMLPFENIKIFRTHQL